MLITNILLFLIALVILIKAAEITVQSLTKVSFWFGLSEFILASILMAFATTLPELFVGISAALANQPLLSIGDSLGSNIADLTVVTGLIIFFARKIKAENLISKKDAVITGAISFLPLLLILDKNLTRMDGIILLGVYAFYMARQISKRKHFTKKTGTAKNGIIKNLFVLFAAIVVLLLSSRLLVDSAVFVANYVQLPEFLIGLVVIALGTSIPELVFGIKAVQSKHDSMAMGDLLGAFVANICLVCGLVILISPVDSITSFNSLLVTTIMLPIIYTIFTAFAFIKSGFTLVEGGILFALYAFFILVSTFLAK